MKAVNVDQGEANGEPRVHRFETPEPISLTVEIAVGSVSVSASDRLDSVIEVLPSRPEQRADRAAAAQVTVERAGNLLVVKAPRRWTEHFTGWGGRGAVEVRVSVPVDTQLRVDAGAARVLCSGRLREAEVSTFGDVHVDEAGPLRVRTAGGDISVDKVGVELEAKTGTGSIRIGAVDGPATVRNSNGDTWIGHAGGDLEVRAANGRISVDRADGAVRAQTANGDVVIGEVARGAVLARTAMGRVEVGVRAGVAAWLDLHTHFGNVHNDLDGGGPPAPGEAAVEIRATTSFGDVTVRRQQRKEGS